MPRQLHPLPGREVGKDLPAGFRNLGFDELDLLFEADSQRMRLRMSPEIFQFILQFDDRFLEIELVFHRLEVRQAGGRRQRRIQVKKVGGPDLSGPPW